jgi:uncharacterized membrane protein
VCGAGTQMIQQQTQQKRTVTIFLPFSSYSHSLSVPIFVSLFLFLLLFIIVSFLLAVLVWQQKRTQENKRKREFKGTGE